MPTGTATAATAARVIGGDLLGHAAAVGVAEHDQPRPASAAAWIACSGVVGVALPAVEEVLGVEDHLAAGRRPGRRRSRRSWPGSPRALVRSTSVAWKIDALPTSVIAAAPESSRASSPWSCGGLDPLAPGHAEGADLDVLEVQRADPLEVLGVLLVGGRIAAFDVVEPQASSRWVRASLSWSEKLIPSPWEPSRKVVS